jgi:hypothetical protein
MGRGNEGEEEFFKEVETQPVFFTPPRERKENYVSDAFVLISGHNSPNVYSPCTNR